MRRKVELAEAFAAFGYPEDIFGHDARLPTGRVFRGHYQRLYRHDSFRGQSYEAAELSIPAPAGLSGGPTFRPGSMHDLTGIVTENLESTTTLDAVEEIQADGKERREVYRKVITYGVALLLGGVVDWLEQTIPFQPGR